MTYNVDVDGEYKLAKTAYLRSSLLFSFILTLVLTADTLLVVLAKDNYLVNYIVATIITIVFSWYAIFFFTTIDKDINARYRYFKNYKSGLQPNEEVEFIKIEEELQQVKKQLTKRNISCLLPKWLRF